MIYNKLLKLKDELGMKALRDPRTADELLVKKKLHPRDDNTMEALQLWHGGEIGRDL